MAIIIIYSFVIYFMRVREGEAKNIQKKLQIIIDSECFNDLGIIYAIKNILFYIN